MFDGPTQIDDGNANVIVANIPMICRDCRTKFKVGTLFAMENDEESKIQCPKCKLWTKIGYFN